MSKLFHSSDCDLQGHEWAYDDEWGPTDGNMRCIHCGDEQPDDTGRTGCVDEH